MIVVHFRDAIVMSTPKKTYGEGRFFFPFAFFFFFKWSAEKTQKRRVQNRSSPARKNHKTRVLNDQSGNPTRTYHPEEKTNQCLKTNDVPII